MDKNYILNKLKESLLVRLSDFHVNDISLISRIYENGEGLYGLCFDMDENVVKPCLYLSEEDFEIADQEYLTLIDSLRQRFIITIKYLNEYKKALMGNDVPIENMSLAAVNREKNEHLLSHVPHRDYLDISLVIKLDLHDIDERTGCGFYFDDEYMVRCIVNNKMMNHWKCNEEELIDSVIQRVEMNDQAFFQKLEYMVDTMFDMGDELKMDELTDDLEFDSLYVLTNSSFYHGASTIFYNKAVNGIYEFFGTPFYMIPANVHEFFVIAIDNIMCALYLKHMIDEVNCYILREDELLSNNIYYFNPEIMSLEIISQENGLNKFVRF